MVWHTFQKDLAAAVLEQTVAKQEWKLEDHMYEVAKKSKQGMMILA